MLAIVFFQESRPILVSIDSNPEAASIHEAILGALKQSGYEETPASFVALAVGQDVVIGEVETVSLADLGSVRFKDNFETDFTFFADELDATGVWSPVMPSPLAELIEAAEDAAFPDENKDG